MNAAVKALESGDVSSIQPQSCLHTTNESSFHAYKEETLFQAWGSERSENIRQRKMTEISPSFRTIYSTYASRCCEVRSEW